MKACVRKKIWGLDDDDDDDDLPVDSHSSGGKEHFPSHL